MGELEAKFLNYHVVLMAVAAWIILWSVRKIWSGMDTNKWLKKLKPLYAAVLCSGFVWIPGVLPEAEVGERILVAIWAGFLASIGYQLLRRFVRSKAGVELPEDPDQLVPGGAPSKNESTSSSKLDLVDAEADLGDDGE